MKDWNKIIAKLDEHLEECTDHFCNICSDITSGKFDLESAFEEITPRKKQETTE